jgi:hypothetical protein
MKHIKPFSKEMYDGDTVSNDDGQRSGFTEHYKITKCDRGTPIPHMAGFYPYKSTLERTSGNQPGHPEFKNTADDGLPDFPAPFSKKSIKGGPAHPGTPA